METIIGVTGADFVMLAADSAQMHSIVVVKEDEKKIRKIADNLMIATVGDPGDTVKFTDFIAHHIGLYKLSNGYALSPKAAAHFTRKHLSDYLRSRTNYYINMLIAGYDEKEGPELCFIDYMASSVSLKCAGHGYGALFCNSILDRYHKPDLNQEEGYDLLKMCVSEIQRRLVLNQNTFFVSVVDKNGIRDLPPITHA